MGLVGVGVDVRVHVCVGVYRGDAFAAPMYRAAPASARPGLYQPICTAVLSFQVHTVRVLHLHNRPFLYGCEVVGAGYLPCFQARNGSSYSVVLQEDSTASVAGTNGRIELPFYVAM